MAGRRGEFYLCGAGSQKHQCSKKKHPHCAPFSLHVIYPQKLSDRGKYVEEISQHPASPRSLLLRDPAITRTGVNLPLNMDRVVRCFTQCGSIAQHFLARQLAEVAVVGLMVRAILATFHRLQTPKPCT